MNDHTINRIQHVAQETIKRDLTAIELMQVNMNLDTELGMLMMRVEADLCDDELIQGAIRKVLDVTSIDPTVKKMLLIKFYKNAIGRFEGDQSERLIFLQCVASLDVSERLGLEELYTDDYNETLAAYQKEKEHDVD